MYVCMYIYIYTVGAIAIEFTGVLENVSPDFRAHAAKDIHQTLARGTRSQKSGYSVKRDLLQCQKSSQKSGPVYLLDIKLLCRVLYRYSEKYFLSLSLSLSLARARALSLSLVSVFENICPCTALVN